MDFLACSGFTDLRRPVEASSDVLYSDFYYSALSKACAVSPAVNSVTLGPNADANPGQPVETSTPKKTQNMRPLNSRVKSTLPNRNLPRKPKFLTIPPTDVQNRLIQTHLIKRQCEETGKVTACLEANALTTEGEIKKSLNEAYMKNLQKRQTDSEVLNQALLQIMRAKLRGDDMKDQVERMKKERESSKKSTMRKLYESVVKCHEEFVSSYTKLNDVLTKCEDTRQLSQNVLDLIQNVKASRIVIESQTEKAKKEGLDDKDLDEATKIVSQINTALNMTKIEVDQIEANKKLIPEKVAEKKETPEINSVADEDLTLGCCVQSTLPSFLKLKELLETVEKMLQPILNDSNLTNYRFELHKAVQTPTNSITATSSQHMLDKYEKLRNLLCGGKTTSGVSATDHPSGNLFIRHLMAKKFVQQSETVRTRGDAFAIASILVALWTEFPDFGELVHAQFLHHCPFLVPIYWPKLEGQSDEDYYKMMGYKVRKGEIEKQELFLERMTRIMRLYAAVLVTPPRNGAPNPLGLKEAWRWLSCVCNLQPHPDVTCALIPELLAIAGADFLEIYGTQARKLLSFVFGEYSTMLEKVTRPALVTQLKTFMEETIVKKGTIPQPSGRLPSNFW